MNPRDYYKVTYTNSNGNFVDGKRTNLLLTRNRGLFDNETEFNANQFKLYDDFATDVRIDLGSIRGHQRASDAVRRRGDPDDSGVDVENGNAFDHSDLLENEVMVDPWSSMDSSNSPLTDSVPSEDCTPSTSSEPPRGSLDVSSPLSPDARRLPDPNDTNPKTSKCIPKTVTDKARSRDLTLELETLEPDPHPRRPHFLDDDFPPSRSNIECRIPKPHFLDHSPSPDEFDERSDITNPNFLDDDVDGDENQAQKKSGALPKRPARTPSTSYATPEDRPTRSNYRSALQYGLENAARSSERDKRASQLYRGTWPGERDVWTSHDSSSVRSFSSNGSDCARPSSNLENKMECVCSLISLLSLSPENNADLSGPLLDMSRSVESCIAMRQAGCIPLLVQLIHSKVPRETRDRAAKALCNIIHTQTDDKAGRREARVWRLLEQVREYCYALEDLVESRKEEKETIEDDTTKHPSQSVAALMKLSFDEEHRHVVCQLGGLQALAALVSGDQAAHGSRTDDNTCLTMRKYAGMTLTNLTFGDGNNKSLLCSFKDFMLALVEQLESPNDDMRQVTAAVLRNLSWRADTNSKQVLREVGAVKGLTKAAMTCQKEATLKSVLSALWNLTAHCSMNKVALCSVDGALGFLVDMLSYNSPTKTLAIVENAGGIMRNVSSHIAVREDYRQILRERNCLSVLLQHLKSPSLTVVSNSCGTLWNLSARCPQDQQYLWDHGAVPMLRSLIHSKHKMIAMGSSAALKNLLNSKPGKTHIISLDTTARSMNLPALPTLGARKQKALEQELDQNLAETCDNIEPATSPTTSNRDEKNLFTATERQIAMNLERHRMTSSSPLMGTLSSQISLSHSAHLASYLSCSNTLLKGAISSRSTTGGSSNNVNRSESKDSVTSTHSDSVFERVMRTGKVPVPTPRNKDLMKMESVGEDFKTPKPLDRDSTYLRYTNSPPVPPPRSSTDMRTNYTESGYDVDQDSCDQPIDFSRKYSETKTSESEPPLMEKAKTSEPTKKYTKKENPTTFGDYQETDLDQPTNYSLRYAEHQSETGSDISEPLGPSVHEDSIKHFATEGTPYETPIIFSTATSMSDLRVIGKDGKPRVTPNVKEHPEVMTHSDEKDTCSIEDPPRHDNDRAISASQMASTAEPASEKQGVFDTKFSSGMISPEKPVNYCDEGTPGYFSRVSSLSSLGEPTEEDCLAKKNALATINVDPAAQEQSTSGSAKDKEGSKAVTFATEPVSASAGEAEGGQAFVEDTPLMFSRSSSLGSLPECSQQDDHASVVSEVSRLTSGCISPSEIPDSPGQSAPLSPRPRPRLPPEPGTPPPESRDESVFAERVSRFVVEHTPAQFSARTSLSSLTIHDEPATPAHKEPLLLAKETGSEPDASPPADETLPLPDEHLPTEQRHAGLAINPIKGSATPGDSCQLYCTEDTPAPLSAAGSRSSLSALSLDSAPPPPARPARPAPAAHDTSDSSNLSDAGDVLEECIQKGIAQVVKNKASPTDVAAISPYPVRDDVYRSLPPYLRSSTETVKMSHELARNIRDSRSSSVSASPPPLPPKASARGAAPPRPPPLDDHPSLAEGMKHASGVRPDEPERRELARTDSLSSLSLDSFGSTDREIFEETVRAGLAPRRSHRSLDRADRSAHRRARARDPDLERLPGARPRRRPDERAASDPARPGGRAPRDGPPSLPGRLDRGDSPGSLSNDSFGSADKEVFERCVRAGMGEARARPRRRDALERMAAAHGRERALLEEVIARGAAPDARSKNVPPPPAEVAAAGERAPPARDPPPGSERAGARADEEPTTTFPVRERADEPTFDPIELFTSSAAERPASDSCNTTLSFDAIELTRSNERLAPRAPDCAAVESERDELNASNESYAEVVDASWSDDDPDARRSEDAWTDAKVGPDTWNDNTCPDDVTFPTVSGSVRLEPAAALPDLLAGSAAPHVLIGPDLTERLEGLAAGGGCALLDDVEAPVYASMAPDEGPGYDSIVSSVIEKEAARLAARLRSTPCGLEASATSLASLDLDRVRPPSLLGSLLSLSASGHWDDSLASKRSQRSGRKSLPAVAMAKRALGPSALRDSSEHLEAVPVSLLDNVKPPSEMEHLDMESSMISVSSIVSEVAEVRDGTPVVFDFRQPIRDFPMCGDLGGVFHDLDKVNPPSLFDEMAESTLEVEPTTAQEVDEGASSTLNVVTDLPSGSENCTPLPSDVSSLESTPKKRRDPRYLTPKEKRTAAKYRYQTYTITDAAAERDVVLEVQAQEFVTWTKSESDRSDDCVTATSDDKPRRRPSAKQRRLEDRARYQTQTVDVDNIPSPALHPDPHLESLKRRLAAKKTLKQRRVEDAERFRTRTLSEDIPPSPTFVTRDANFENLETTTGYDSLSSNEPTHQQLADERGGDADSGHNEDECEPADLCLVNNLKNIEMTASYRRAANTSSGDFAGSDADSNSEKHYESDSESPLARPKPKIIKPERDGSLDSNDSEDRDPEPPKVVRGRKKAAYVSPYRRSDPPPRKLSAAPKTIPRSLPKAPGPRVQASAKPQAKPTIKPTGVNTSPKKASPNKSPSKTPGAPQTPPARPLPLERQGTFTKEESTVPAKDLPVNDKKSTVPRLGVAKPANTSPSRLPQLSRGTRPPASKQAPAQGVTKQSKPMRKTPETGMRNSPSNHSLQSNDSGKTIVLARGSRQGSTSSVNSASSRTREVESKIAGLWKRTDRRAKKVWIDSDKDDPPRLIRSSTFEGQPKQSQPQTAPKQKSAIGIRVSQIPSLRPKSNTTKATTQPGAKKTTAARVFARKPVNVQTS